MNSRNAWSRKSTWFTAAGVLLASSGCSLLYDFNTSQCNTTPDCQQKGPQFAYSVCQNHVCVQTAPGTGGSSAGGQGGTTGGDTSAGGTSAQAGQNTGGSGTGGTSAECATNNDCVINHNAPYICKGGSCVALTDTTNCPVLIPQSKYNEILTDPTLSPIIIGGFASMGNSAAPYDTLAVINWDLAFTEFYNNTSKGLPGTSASGMRAQPFLGLICNGNGTDATHVAANMQHLTEEVGVTAILSTLSSDFLLDAWNFTVPPATPDAGPAYTGKTVFFMNTGSATLKITDQTQTQKRMWHMLGDPHVLAGTVVTLLNQIIPYVNAQRQANYNANNSNENPSVPLRVTLVYSTHPTMLDAETVLTTYDPTNHPEDMISINGAWALDSSNSANWHNVQIDSANETATPVVTNATNSLTTYPPHIIIAMTTSEFPKSVIPVVEAGWPTNAPGVIRPYYIMSHLTYNNSYLLADASQYSSITPPLNNRVVGVNYAEAQDPTSKGLYNSYLSNLESSYSPTGALYSQLPGTENYYDGAYYLLYSIAAAAALNITPEGKDISDALLGRVINNTDTPAAPTVYVQPSAIGTTVGQLFLKQTYDMSLWGTMGPPNFNRNTGTRYSPTSAWCVQKSGTPAAWACQADGLVYDSVARTFSPNSAGVPACLQSYCPGLDAGVTTCPQNY